jgi:hypothetical protein
MFRHDYGGLMGTSDPDPELRPQADRELQSTTSRGPRPDASFGKRVKRVRKALRLISAGLLEFILYAGLAGGIAFIVLVGSGLGGKMEYSMLVVVHIPWTMRTDLLRRKNENALDR